MDFWDGRRGREDSDKFDTAAAVVVQAGNIDLAGQDRGQFVRNRNIEQLQQIDRSLIWPGIFLPLMTRDGSVPGPMLPGRR